MNSQLQVKRHDFLLKKASLVQNNITAKNSSMHHGINFLSPKSVSNLKEKKKKGSVTMKTFRQRPVTSIDFQTQHVPRPFSVGFNGTFCSLRKELGANKCKLNMLLWGTPHLYKKTEEESEKIKEKLASYDYIIKQQYTFCFNVIYRKVDQEIDFKSVSHQDLLKKFNNIAFQINLLLAQNKKILALAPGIEENVSLNAGTKCNYKIPSKKQNVPLKLHIEIENGIGFGCIILSQRLSRPTIDNCDKNDPIG